MKAAMPPARWALATACRATVVLPEALGAVDLDDTAAGQPADAERDVEGDGPRGDDLDGRSHVVAEAHDRTLAVLLLDLPEDHSQGLRAVVGDGCCSHVAPALPVSFDVRARRRPVSAVGLVAISGQTLGRRTDSRLQAPWRLWTGAEGPATCGQH